MNMRSRMLEPRVGEDTCSDHPERDRVVRNCLSIVERVQFNSGCGHDKWGRLKSPPTMVLELLVRRFATGGE